MLTTARLFLFSVYNACAAGKYPACQSTEYPTPACPIENNKGCSEGSYATSWKADKHKARFV